MTPSDFLAQILIPDLEWLAGVIPGIPVSESAVALMLAIAGQESGWRDVSQAGSGYARGPWQMQMNTCADILSNRVTDAKAIIVCATLRVHPAPAAVFDALLANSKLATAFARLDLWACPEPLPAVGDQKGAWVYYDKVWGPGDPRPAAWPENYQAALAALKAREPIA